MVFLIFFRGLCGGVSNFFSSHFQTEKGRMMRFSAQKRIFFKASRATNRIFLSFFKRILELKEGRHIDMEKTQYFSYSAKSILVESIFIQMQHPNY